MTVPRTYLIMASLICFSGPLGAATIVVDPDGSGDHTDIQAAIDAAAVGDTVLVKPSEYLIVRPIEFRGRAISLRSEGGPEVTTIRMSDSPVDPERTSVVILESGEGAETLLEGFTLTGGRGTRMRLGENASFGGRCWAGGGLLIRGASPIVRDCTIVENTVQVGAACILDEGSPTLVDCRILRNTRTANWPGGAVWCGTGATPALESCTIAENVGSGLYMEVSTVSLTSCRIVRNTNDGIVCYAAGEAILSDCTIAGNLNSGLSQERTSVEFERCTIAGNTNSGIDWEGGGSVTLRHSIVWGNGASSFEIHTDPPQRLPVAFDSCIEGDPPILGSGNIHDDPLFCGWVGGGEVFVDASALAPGDGSESSPYPDLASVLDGFSYALSPGSPCIGAAGKGGNLGADNGLCGTPAQAARTVHLAPGSYSIFGWNLSHDVSLEGAGREETTVEGTVLGLRTGSRLSRLAVTGGRNGGVNVPRGQAPEISDCAIAGNQRQGLSCAEGSSPEVTGSVISDNEQEGVLCSLASPTLRECRITNNREVGLACSGLNSSPKLIGCLISGNGSAGVTCGKFSTALLENCTLAENAGGGLTCDGLASPTLEHCTVVANWGTGEEGSRGAGIHLKDQALAVVKSSIVWGNLGGAIVKEDGAFETVSHSCVEGEGVWEGPGNVAEDPLFCAWGALAEVWVDASNAAEGDGTESNPYRELSQALEFSLGLADTSPCVGSGEGGSNMGAEHGVCNDPGATKRTVHLPPGTYSIDGSTLAHHASFQGADEEETIVEGTVTGLRTGARLSHLTVTKGTSGGIVVSGGQAPEISVCTISRSAGDGVTCNGGAAPRFEDCTIIESTGVGLSSRSALPRLSRCWILRNAAGGVWGWDSTVVFQDCEISENSSMHHGCYFRNSDVTLSGCSIRGNRARDRAGVELEHCRGTFVNCEIIGNWSRLAGAIFVFGESDPPEELTFVNCTIAGNLVDGDPWGGSGNGSGVWVGESSMVSFTNCTIAQNTALNGPGAAVYCHENGYLTPPLRGNPKLTNIILWGNSPNSSCGRIRHCLTREDPLFLSPGVFDFTRFKTVTIQGEEHVLPDFVVEEPDFHLQEGSPAIDAGTTEEAPASDMDGNPRPLGDAPDIGAYEFEPPAIRFVRGDFDGDGSIQGTTDALYFLTYWFVGTDAPPCTAACDANGNGTVEVLGDAVYLLAYTLRSGPNPPEPFPECGESRLGTDAALGCLYPSVGCQEE